MILAITLLCIILKLEPCPTVLPNFSKMYPTKKLPHLLVIECCLSWHTTKTEWTEVRHAARREGASGYNLPRLILLTMNLIFAYTTVPLRFMTWFGFVSFWICLFFVIYFIYLKITMGSPLGFTALIVSVFMSTGMILFSLGIIGEYLNRLFALQHRKPPYLIQEILR